jgi:hypothetical protein
VLSKLKKGIKDPKLIVLYLLRLNISKVVPDKTFLKIYYYFKVGKKLDFNNPKLFNEKLQWLKVFDRKPIYTRMVDKYEVRGVVRSTIGDKYLIPLIGVYDSFEEIDFNKLPDQFVLKCTHDSGGIVICKNKAKLDIELAKQKINNSLEKNYYNFYREWPYKNVRKKIVCEKYMVDESGKELKDYKFFCFNGEPKLIQVDFNRFVNHKRNFYDVNWNYLDIRFQYPSDANFNLQKPDKLEEMLELSRKLSKELSFARTDFYSIKNSIFFGEITFYPEAGFSNFEPLSFNNKLGSWIKIS